MDAAEAAHAVVRAGPLLLLGLLPYGLSLAADGWGFSRLLRRVGCRIHPIGLAGTRASAEALAISLPGGALIAESVKPFLLRSRFGVPLEEGAGGMAARKCLIVAGHGAYIGLAVALGWGWLATQSQRLTGAAGLPWLVLGSGVGIGAVAVAMRFAFGSGTLVSRLSGLAGRIPFAALRSRLESAKRSFDRADAGLRRMLELRSGAASLPAFVIMWMCEALESWLLLRLFGAELGFVETLALEATISAVRAFAFFAPAGIGFQDAGYLALLGTGGPGASVAAAFVLAKRLRELVWIGIGYALLAVDRRGPAHHESWSA
ncbi:hypothetical protein AKJ08_2381 [Vulgatibacter incomptus]|uniref:Uncharacterized protein n=1 Tax=Vulgatibacter incomptus TaxID=1391653 RepID=A0A0K1PFV3_9BACT|nr:hypothetical protein AKJ08_2381 [Vulgatibacter incomptus]